MLLCHMKGVEYFFCFYPLVRVYWSPRRPKKSWKVVSNGVTKCRVEAKTHRQYKRWTEWRRYR